MSDLLKGALGTALAIAMVAALLFSAHALRSARGVQSSAAFSPSLSQLQSPTPVAPSPIPSPSEIPTPSPTLTPAPPPKLVGPVNPSVPPPPGTWCAAPGPWQPAFVLQSFSVTGEATGTSSNTVTISWSATDHCPPYTGSLRASWRPSDPTALFLSKNWNITTLSGTITQQFDCSTLFHPEQVTYTFALLDRASVGVPSKNAQAFVC